MKLYQVLVVGLLSVGVVGSIKDYRDWRYQETYRYGHGIDASVVKLAGPYQNDLAKFRLKFPQGWLIEEDKAGGVRFYDGQKASISVRVEAATKNLPELVAMEVAKLAALGSKLSREWEYVNGEKMGFTVVTWSGQQKAMGVKEGKLVIIDAENAGQIDEVYKSVVLF